MSEQNKMQQGKEKSEPASDKNSRAALVNAVTTPLAFFTLVILVMETGLGIGAYNSNGIVQIFLVITFCVVLILLILLVWFMAWHRPASLYGKSASDALTLVNEIKTMLQKVEEIVEHAKLARTAHDLGVAGIGCDWKELAEFKEGGELGTILKSRLTHVENATWYIVTMNPGGFLYWLKYIARAVEYRGVDVKWAYFGRKSIEDDPALRLLGVQLAEWLSRNPDNALNSLRINTETLLREAGESRRRIHEMSGERRKRAGHWELYESKVPHFYMAFLSVPKEYERKLEQVPAGTFGFVYLYPMFARSGDKHDTRPVLYLEASGQSQPDILDCYYWSIVRMFDKGVKQGHLLPTWSSEA